MVVLGDSQVRGTNSRRVVMRSALCSPYISFIKNSNSSDGNA